jgi:hypothetical protein
MGTRRSEPSLDPARPPTMSGRRRRPRRRLGDRTRSDVGPSPGSSPTATAARPASRGLRSSPVRGPPSVPRDASRDRGFAVGPFDATAARTRAPPVSAARHSDPGAVSAFPVGWGGARLLP